MKGADELPPEHFEAVQPAAFLAAKIEVEGVPKRVRVAGVVAEDVELRLPFAAAILRPNRIRKRPVEGIAPGDPEQLQRGGVDEVRKLLDLIVQKAVEGVQAKLVLN